MHAKERTISDYVRALEQHTHTLAQWLHDKHWMMEDAVIALITINSVICLQKVSTTTTHLQSWAQQTAKPLVEKFFQNESDSARTMFWTEIATFLMQQATDTGLTQKSRWCEPSFHDHITISPSSLKLISLPGEPNLPIETKTMELAAFLSAQDWTSYEILCVGLSLIATVLEGDPSATIHQHSTADKLDCTPITTSNPNHLGFFFFAILGMAAETRFEKPNKHPFIWEGPTKPENGPTSTQTLEQIRLPEAPTDGSLKRSTKWNETIQSIQLAIHHHQPKVAQKLISRALAISENWPSSTPYHALTQTLAVLTTCLDHTAPFPSVQWEQATNKLASVTSQHSLAALTNILTHIIAVLQEQDRGHDTLPVLRTWLYTMERFYGPSHQGTLLALSELTETLADLYQFSDAYPLAKDLAKRHLAIHGPTHPKTLEALNNLASHATQFGRFEEAEKLLLNILVQTNTNPDMARLLAVSRDNLASVYAAQEDWPKAIEHYEQLLEETAHLTGPEAKDRIPYLLNLASVYMSTNNSEQAIPFLEQAYQLTKTYQLLGTLQGIIIATRWVIALQSVGRHIDATPILEILIPQAQRALGPTHPETLHAQIFMAANLQSQGLTDEAEQLFRSIISIAETDPKILEPILQMALDFLIYNMEHYGRYEEAEPFREKLKNL
ncbi:MAG: tetratricopeptide repeat protein [Pseudomonadota bacterium]